MFTQRPVKVEKRLTLIPLKLGRNKRWFDFFFYFVYIVYNVVLCIRKVNSLGDFGVPKGLLFV
jgi:hypothetical protein